MPAGSARNWLQVIAGSLSAHRKWGCNVVLRGDRSSRAGGCVMLRSV